ncbi:hypothetical protein [Tenacibaculum maritimum]|uniref:hypothetical protein n=1 Tax=Tenacibaculum maritimum TaxID=107401 RepID=UPI0038773EF1
MKTKLEDNITSLRTVSYAVLLYIAGYALKLTVLLDELLQNIIPLFYVRISASLFTGVALSMGLLIVSINNHKKYLPYILAIMDATALLLLFKIFKLSKPSEILTTIFISCFMAFVGYQLITVFVGKYQQVKSGTQQKISEIQTTLSELTAKLNERKQTLEDIEHQISETKQYTCSDCGREFGSKNALNGHKNFCKNKPKSEI